MKKKTVTLSTAKKKAWTAFSRYIRLRDSLRWHNSTDFGSCFTCKRIYPNWRVGGLQAGHFIPGRKNAYLFDERGVHSQCNVCNKHLKGNWVNYRTEMIKYYGPEVTQELENLYNSHATVSMKVYQYQEIEDKYKVLYTQLLSGKKV